jgi:hypothetical protein
MGFFDFGGKFLDAGNDAELIGEWWRQFWQNSLLAVKSFSKDVQKAYDGFLYRSVRPRKLQGSQHPAVYVFHGGPAPLLHDLLPELLAL